MYCRLLYVGGVVCLGGVILSTLLPLCPTLSLWRYGASRHGDFTERGARLVYRRDFPGQCGGCALSRWRGV